MPVLISGVLKDGTGTPVQNCTIQLKACRTSTTVVVNTVASENPDDAGRYSMDVEQGQYTVTLLVDGYPPSHAGVITVYDDSKPGTLNDFLGAMTEDDVRPEALRRFEAMVEEVARQASEASRNATAAGQASEQAQTSAGQASESATAAVNAAGAAEASATQAASSAASAESSAGTATTKAGEASASAASADTARTAAAASAAAAKTSEANADASRTAAGDSAAAAAASETAAQTSAARAGASETAAKTSETQAASSAGDAGASATAAAASEKAAAASAAEAKTSETNAATSASTAAASATAASSSASEASNHAAASDTSASLAAQSSTAAGAAATRAEEAAKRAEDIADVISLEDASLTKKGIVKLSSATDSDSEALAATPKAVKIVMGEVQTKAPLDSPALTGTPTAPTPETTAAGIEIATAAFVAAKVAQLVGSAPEALDTLKELADALGNDPNFATTVLNKLAGKQPLDGTLTNLSGKDVPALLQYLGLGETINLAAGALQKDQNGGDIPDKAKFVENLGLKETLNPTKRVSIGNIGTGVFDGSTPCINIGDSDSGFIGSADGVLDIYCNGAKVGYINGNGLHMLTDIHFDNARMTTNGDIFGSVWGNTWLSIWITNQLNTRGTIDWINGELAVRDNNINTRATWDYVNQTFARKNSASIQDWGWILDDSTGFIMQWGTLGNSNGTYNFPRAFPVGCFAVFVTNTNAQGAQVDNAFGYPVSNSQFFAATKSSGIANLVNNFPVAWFAIGR
ncbi:prophage tail fiber N-terminal domain-containing protein [Salmonella enterica subsp. enterica serovar Abony]|nr:prophage tail fiber N-terminal domain-containing protein [Salmonella enterica subsp. enterica serovar Abony]HBD1791500.1 prophage tail fiber N-terminal domain-containing protein [Salmonella enterica]